ncbi:alpha/beta hydrolase [Gordonia sp. L191]|uniref:alpha/beta hydrolase n=1 Tax=Gordonia sp. L191 TaxID=2982699 RepID=UPI0024BF4C84|nr:alpha/beta hydrolase [Gordonia sp. L191]WHU45492.1 alpha/beta hydrolase [Gordonia sp. L191]
MFIHLSPPAPGDGPRRQRRVGLAAALAALVILVSACGSGGDITSDTGGHQVDWKPCPEQEAVIDGLQCATFEVPLDHRSDSSKKITLALRRMPAGGTSKGTLFFNPGGPGGTGTVQFPQWYGRFPERLRTDYDIVSWDPRGVGESTAVQCYPHSAAENNALADVDQLPLTFDAQAAFAAGYTALADRCASSAADLAAHVSTADTARDLEQLRHALGDKPLNYWGVSYGTFLGMTYANLYPTSVRSMVLDGNLSPLAWTDDGRSPATQTLGMRIGSMDNASVFDQFLILCTEAGSARCPFAASTADATRAKWTELVNRLAVTPAVLTEGSATKVIDLPTLVNDISDGLDVVWPIPGSAQGWAAVSAALQKIYQAATTAPESPAPGAPNQTAGQSPTQSAADTTYAGPEQVLSIACGDSAAVTPQRIPTLAVEAQQQAGLLGLSTMYGDAPCAYWKVRAADPYTGPWNATTSAPALIVNTTHDPSTPMKNAEANARLLDKSVLLTVDGYGHTSLLNPSSCADKAITAYIENGDLPVPGTRCTQDRSPFQP